MNHRHLGQSGLVVSEISYGNWITHALQVEKEAARRSVEGGRRKAVANSEARRGSANLQNGLGRGGGWGRELGFRRSRVCRSSRHWVGGYGEARREGRGARSCCQVLADQVVHADWFWA